MKETPVYIFSGFLESGKTLFCQDTLEDEKFNNGEKTLLLVCEEGEEEYEPSRFAGKNVKIKVLEDKEELTEANLSLWARECNAQRVVVEYNGMWLLQELYDAMPEGWIPYQNMLFADASTILSYNANMRNLVVDKLKECDVCVFNRVPQGFDTMELHKLVRAISRRCDIIYESVDGSIVPDEIEDPLPFDLDADFIALSDRDYALFYRDITEEPKKYKGKRLQLKVLAATDKKFPADTCALGRHIMTCCAADITYCPLVARLNGIPVENSAWYIATVKIDFRFSRLYGKKGPVYDVESLEKTTEPLEPVATFY